MSIPRILPLLTIVLAACGESRDTTAKGDAPASDPAPAQATRTQPGPTPTPMPREGILLAFSADSGRYVLEPIALITRGGLRDPWHTEDNDAFNRRYFAPGTHYTVHSMGALSGEARVLRMMEPGCTERVAEASFTDATPQPPVGGGLASDAFGPATAHRLMRVPMVPEESELASLADSIHASHRIPTAARARTRNQRLFAVTIPGVEQPVLVGTFNVTVTGEDETEQTYNQLLVAEAADGAYRPAYIHHDRDDGETGMRSLLDVADLDGDGVPEMVVQVMYNEGWGFAVLKRGPAGWTEIYRGGGAMC
jgi:hypothetical protein